MIARSLATWTLATAAVLAIVHVVARAGGASVDLSRTPPLEVTPALRERLASLDQELLFTYAASAPATMPSDLRGVPPRVETLLRAIEKEGAGRVRVQIVDPAADPGVAGTLASIGLAPFRASALEVDLEVERSVWSSLRIAYGAKGAAAIREVTPAILPDLQALIAAHLDLLERPRRPRVALAAPLEFGKLRRALRTDAEVLECDFELDAKIPEEADLFLWIDPARAEPIHLAALHALQDRGRSVVIAGSCLRADSTDERTSYPTSLPREFGLAAVDAVLLEGGPDSGSPLVRSIGTEQDFRALALGAPGVHGQPNGSLLFAAPTVFEPAALRLRELGLAMFPLASSSDDTWIRSAPGGTGNARAPRSTLLALLAPDSTSDPRRGSVVFAASSSPFSDEYLKHEAFAHVELLSLLVRSLGSDERMATLGATIQGPVRIPELPPGKRTALSASVALATPLLLLLAALLSGAAPAMRRARPVFRLHPPVLLAATAAAAILLLARIASEEVALDLTREGRNGLAPETRAILAEQVSPEQPVRPVQIDCCFSADSRLPAWLRSSAREARATARRFADAASGLSVVDLEPDEGDAGAITALASDGVLPLDVPSDSQGRGLGGRTPRVYAAIRLAAGGRTEVLRFQDRASFEHLEFRLVHALEKLRGNAVAGREPRIAIVSSAPKLPPAEAQSYQKRGLFAPGGGDRFTGVRALLEANDFVVAGLDPAKPEAPAGTDLLVCLEPRRDAGAMVAAAATHLAGGGRVLLAAQHFGVRSRRTQAAGLRLDLVPEPWFPDLDRLYFPSLGIELVREVLMDELHGSAEVETEIEREPGRSDRVRERATSPLFVRGIPEFVLECPSRIRVDREKLAGHGISAREWITTSERSWSFDWKGGDLPEDVLSGPRDGIYLGRQPLAMLFEGRFPPPGSNADLSGGVAPSSVPGGVPAGEVGKLLLVGCSQLFRDGSLETSGDRAQLLLSSVAALTLPTDLAKIVARRSTPPAIGLVAARERILWRLVVVGAAPAAILLLGMFRSRGPSRRRSVP